MIKYIVPFITISLLLPSCNNTDRSSVDKKQPKALKKVELDTISCNIIMSGKKEVIKKYRLDNLENGYDPFEIRIWFSKGKYIYTRLLIIKEHTAKKVISLENYFYFIDKNRHYKLINSKRNISKKKLLLTVDQSAELKQKIMEFKILEYPKKYFYASEETITIHGTSYFIEIATPGSYVHYSYLNFEEKAKQYQHVNLLNSFITYLDKNFEVYDVSGPH